MTAARMRLDAGVLAHDEDRLGRVAGVLEDDRDRVAAGQRHSPASAEELAVVEVAQGVGGEEAVRLQEGAQQRPVGRLLDRRCDRARGGPGRRVVTVAPARHEPRRPRAALGDPGRCLRRRRRSSLDPSAAQYWMTLVVL